MDLAELSLGRDARAAEIVENSPDVVVPDRTIIEPEGGEVRTAPREAVHSIDETRYKQASLNIDDVTGYADDTSFEYLYTPLSGNKAGLR